MGQKDKQKNSFTIKDMPQEERPRERMKRLGAAQMSAEELLAIILGRGIPNESVTVTAKRLVEKYITLESIGAASLEELTKTRGIGIAKACQLKAAFELANRFERSSPSMDQPFIKNPDDAYELLRVKARGKLKEFFWAIFLNTRSRVIKIVEISSGSLDSSIVHPRELFKEAIAASASTVIAGHNHPSGNPEASRDDIGLTKRLKETGELVGIPLTDHIIIGEGRYISMKREGLF